MSIFTSVGGVRREVPELYVGAAGVTRQVSEGYAGVGGVLRQVYALGGLANFGKLFEEATGAEIRWNDNPNSYSFDAGAQTGFIRNYGTYGNHHYIGAIFVMSFSGTINRAYAFPGISGDDTVRQIYRDGALLFDYYASTETYSDGNNSIILHVTNRCGQNLYESSLGSICLYKDN